MAKIFELQSSNYTEIQLTATADIVAGALVVAGVASNVFPMVDVDYLVEPRYTGILKAEKVLCQKDAVAIVPGEPIYLIVATSIVTNVAGANVLVGYGQAAAEAADATCYIVYDGNAQYLKA